MAKVTRSFYLPESTINLIADYAKLRGISQNQAVNELLHRALGSEQVMSVDDAIGELRARKQEDGQN